MYIFDHDHLLKMPTSRINEVIKDFQEVQYMVQLANQGVGMCEHTQLDEAIICSNQCE